MAEIAGLDDVQMRIAFTKVFGSKWREFGNAATGITGFSDAREGVQWQVGYDAQADVRWAGINLEGMQYDGWPITRLIEREVREISLPDTIRKNPQLNDVILIWHRDYWQATARPVIAEREIAPTPIALGDITREQWLASLLEARDCLDMKRRRLGRATQTVTLPNGDRIQGDVSPHLMFRYVDADAESWETLFRNARAALQPLYDWATRRAAKTVGF